MRTFTRSCRQPFAIGLALLAAWPWSAHLPRAQENAESNPTVALVSADLLPIVDTSNPVERRPLTRAERLNFTGPAALGIAFAGPLPPPPTAGVRVLTTRVQSCTPTRTQLCCLLI